MRTQSRIHQHARSSTRLTSKRWRYKISRCVPIGAHPKSVSLQRNMQVGYDPINKNYTREQLRLADYFENQDSFYKFSAWPGWLQEDMLACPKTFQQRTDCFLHFARNGVYGPTARNWVLACNVIDGKLIWSDAYPEEVRMDMARLVKKALSGELVNDKANTYHHQTGQVIKGLNPAEWPTFQQLRALRAAPRAQNNPGPTRTERQPRSQVTYPPQTVRQKSRLASGVRFVPGLGLSYYDISLDRWKPFNKP